MYAYAIVFLVRFAREFRLTRILNQQINFMYMYVYIRRVPVTIVTG